MPNKRPQYTPLPFTPVYNTRERELVPSLPYKSVAVEDSEVWKAELEEDGYTVIAGVAADGVPVPSAVPEVPLVPASVIVTPVAATMLRIALLLLSATTTVSPSGEKATPDG